MNLLATNVTREPMHMHTSIALFAIVGCILSNFSNKSKEKASVYNVVPLNVFFENPVRLQVDVIYASLFRQVAVKQK